MERRIREAIRYLGYGRCAIDKPTLDLIYESFKELEEKSDVRHVYRIFDLSCSSDKLQLNHIEIQSEKLAVNLQGCDNCIVFGITLGSEIDRLLQRYEKINMAKAVVFQACAAAYLEECCDNIQTEWLSMFADNGKCFRPRFSPGYGDFSIRHQKDILEILDAYRRIGLTMTDGFMLIPTKSVTAVVGIADRDEGCQQVGCELCDKKDCLYRR